MSKKNKKKLPTSEVPCDKSPIIPQNSKIKNVLNIRQRDLTEKQQHFLEMSLNKSTKVMFVSGPAGTSKAQPLDSDILGENGWIKMESVAVGDKIYGEDGNLHNIISLHPQGSKDIYKVSFSDDTSTECTLDHLWFTQTSKERNQRIRDSSKGKNKRVWAPPKSGMVRTTKEILDTLYIRHHSRVNHSIPITNAVNFSNKSHIISPYILGAMLGDGCFRRACNVSFTTEDLEIIYKINKELPKELQIDKIKSSKYDYLITHKNKSEARIAGNYFKNEIKRLNLDMLKSGNKFIPNEYLFDSIDNRIELLRGLLDTDGHICKNSKSIMFTTVSPKLSENVRFLVESLGGICYISTRKNFYTYLNEKKQGQDSFSICISLPPTINPFYLPRKFNMVIPKTKYKPIRYITNIEFVGKKECQCILVNNPSHLYLTNNFIVTHNTFMSVLSALNLLNQKSISDVIYIRSAVESSDSKIGFLPGDSHEKLAPYIQPLIDKLTELLPKSDIISLQKEQRIDSTPIGFLRGLNWNAKCIIVDEAQNITMKELVTIITRVGEFSKVFILGDPDQSDIGSKSGFNKMFDIFNDAESQQNGVFTFKFDENDIVRSGLCKFIIKKIKNLY